MGINVDGANEGISEGASVGRSEIVGAREGDGTRDEVEFPDEAEAVLLEAASTGAPVGACPG